MYAAAFALLLSQLRDKAPMSDVLASVQRLCALARVGSVTLRADAAGEEVPSAVGNALVLLREVFGAHDLEAIDIAATVTDAEFIKLAGILTGPSSSVRGGILETADALSIWNARLHVRGLSPRPTPPGMHVVEPAAWPTPTAPDVPHAAPRPDAHPNAHPDTRADIRQPPPAASVHVPASPASDEPDVSTALVHAVAAAVARDDAAEVCRLLERIENPRRYAEAATRDALVLAVEQLVDVPADRDRVQVLLRRAGVAGARAIFTQLMGSTEMAERRLLYDAAAAHPAIAEVARAHCNHTMWYVVRNAAGLLGESRSPAMIPDLSKLLRHEDARVRAAAVVALGRIGGPVATASLESVLTDPSSDVRNRALAIVFASPESDPLADRMLLALEEESTLEFQLEMIHSLAHVPTPRARGRLEAFVTMEAKTADDYQIRLAAMAALAAGHRPAADPVLRGLLDDPTSTIAERAAALLG